VNSPWRVYHLFCNYVIITTCSHSFFVRSNFYNINTIKNKSRLVIRYVVTPICEVFDESRYLMSIVKQLILALSILCSLCALAQAEVVPSEQRGELLYSTHCNACHNSTIHWREQKLVTDWKSLKAQVKRWRKLNNPTRFRINILALDIK
jgi:hypothetical protein